MTQFQIRPAGPGDLDGLLALEAATPLAPHWSRDAWTKTLAATEDPGASALILLADHAGECIGFIVLRLIVDAAEFESIAVAAAHRRHGLAQALCRAAMQWAAQRGAAALQLEVRSSNTAAMGLYASLGFLPQGVRPRYYQHPVEDAVLLGLTLPSHESVAVAKV